MMKTLLFDVGELGWSMVIAAHLNLLVSKHGNEFAACPYPERECLYNGLNVQLIRLPEMLRVKYSQLDQDGMHLYNHNTQQRVYYDILYKDFNFYFGDDFKVAGIETYTSPNIYKVKPYRYQASDIAREIVNKRFQDKKTILVFPRNRIGKFGSRNLTHDFYVRLCTRLCRVFNDHQIISFGSRKGAFELKFSVPYNNFVDMVRESDFNKLDILIALCETGNVKFAVGSQSAPPKIALVMGVPTFIIGHERQRHMVFDNWMNTRAGFFNPLSFSDGCYIMTDEMIDKCLNEIIEFGENDERKA